MLNEESRLTKLEIVIEEHTKEIDRFRGHISNLLTFMNRVYGALIVLGFIGLGNLALLFRVISK